MWDDEQAKRVGFNEIGDDVMLKKIWHLFMALALFGFTASLAVHVLTLFGFEMPLFVFGLHLGPFVLWLPIVIASIRLAGFTWSWDYYRRIMRGCPRWMRNLANGLAIYAVINVIGIDLGFGSVQPERMLSGFWMLFYFSAVTTFYADIHADEGNCINGHKLLPYKKICPECGATRAEID